MLVGAHQGRSLVPKHRAAMWPRVPLTPAFLLLPLPYMPLERRAGLTVAGSSGSHVPLTQNRCRDWEEQRESQGWRRGP